MAAIFFAEDDSTQRVIFEVVYAGDRYRLFVALEHVVLDTWNRIIPSK